MEYISVVWSSGSKEDPIRMVSELDADRFERRKLEFFEDGSVDAASDFQETPRTALGTMAVPTVEEINIDRQFTAQLITAADFEALWDACR
ncbi:hypothetical protein AXYL_04647 [Achromobacter xylosoxidans A8]|uniref:DUF6881 domain-containing protein n=1 Tax=Achromobacter xylosoxidans (strain A8) TaxID=762376 RepID=E3HIA3_ACHXA|nr:hypothetical protein [Achromobacter xylosoxidans]ADP17962.1 hypothetical protein AXYL_04647 [Achromobacter xylosoxidans A8]